MLRYGPFYGPGTAVAPGGSIVEDVRKRRFPVVGDGGGVWSFVHIDDVASATVAALERGAPGIYNVVDDEPATVAEWLPALAEAIGARPAEARARLRGAGRVRRSRGGDDDRDPRREERQGQAGAGLAAATTRPGERASAQLSAERAARIPGAWTEETDPASGR